PGHPRQDRTRRTHRRRRAMTPPTRPAETGALLAGPVAAAGDSMAVAAWTVVGNTYQFTNSLPNLVYYGFLAGSMFSSLLVPALVRHIDSGDRRASQRVAGGFLGMTLAALVLIAPMAIAIGPLVLRFAAVGAGPHIAA